ISILEIKAERSADPAQAAHIRRELALLAGTRDRALRTSTELKRLAAKLKAVNRALGDLDDALRGCERAQEFGPRFVELARSACRHNDQRAALKRQINALLGARCGDNDS